MGYVINYEDIANMYDSSKFGRLVLPVKLKLIGEEMQKFVDNDNFSGESVMKIKQYFSDIQIPVIQAIIEAYLAFPAYIIKMLDELFEVETNPNARLNEEYLNGLSYKLQEEIDFLLDIGVGVNAEIDNISDITDVGRIKTEAFTNAGFTFLQDKLDKYNQQIKDADDSYCNSELIKLENLVSSVTAIVEKMAHTGAVNILKDDFTTVFPMNDIGKLENYVKAVEEDENPEYTAYLRRLCDAKDFYGGENKKVGLFQTIKNDTDNTIYILKSEINVAIDVAELMFWLPEYAGEKYIYKWEDREFYEWICNYVPAHISDGSLIYAMSLVSRSLDDDTIKNHLVNNREKWIDHIHKKGIFVDGYIDKQEDLTDMYYGVNGSSITADNNSCEIIALYNALYALNGGVASPKYDFPELIAQIEGNGPCINGIWGTSPFIIMCYLQDEGYKVKLYEGKKAQKESNILDLEREYDTYIVTVYNDKSDVSAAVHTMCITKTDIDGEIKYHLRNGNGELPQDSISDCLSAYEDGNSQTICIMGVKQ
ncbi:MAG: LXG domain-containing protein [Clostridium sp.]|nr:LXG domain-containing protein [Clostridium sp.]MCM1209123.1 LXG domain-containing protein [Ruminococcus sp.]